MTGASEQLLLTSSGAAELLALHPSTVKRWCDEGTIPFHRTEGGHRRIRLEDALASGRSKGLRTFLEPFHPWEANVWTAISQARKGGTLQPFQRLHGLALGFLARGQTELLGRLLFEVGNDPVIPFHAFLDHAVRGFMTKVGEDWQAGRLGIGEEHMATQVVTEVLIRLRGGWDATGRLEWSRAPAQAPPTAVVGAPEGDHHDLGAQGIRVLLERMGWRVYFLGPNVPLEEFAQVQRGYGAGMVCISISPGFARPDLHRVFRVLGEFYRPEHPYALALGGSFAESLPEDLPPGPFEGRIMASSARAFQAWIEELWKEQGRPYPRRAA